jgi:NAD(P)-dependent dehydrogenase (short-subunit alcohol dehydrogenase family)
MPKTPDYFNDKTLFLTGAASGIGRAAALIFAREGANVICTDVDAEGNQRTVNQIAQHGGQAEAITADVCSRAAVKDAVAKGLKRFGNIHFLFNSAGAAMRRSKFLDIDDELFDKTFDLNVKGTFYCMQEVLPHMLERGDGVIVNVASMSVKRGGPGSSVHYASAKGAVNTMTMGVAREFASQGIRCLSISPGPIDTNFAAAADTPPELKSKFIADVPMGRMGEADEIGELVLFMCSDACGYMTADTVYVNGGGGWR